MFAQCCHAKIIDSFKMDEKLFNSSNVEIRRQWANSLDDLQSMFLVFESLVFFRCRCQNMNLSETSVPLDHAECYHSHFIRAALRAYLVGSVAARHTSSSFGFSLFGVTTARKYFPFHQVDFVSLLSSNSKQDCDDNFSPKKDCNCIFFHGLLTGLDQAANEGATSPRIYVQSVQLYTKLKIS